MLYTHILVPTDFSPAANQMLAYAFEEATQHHARLTLLHVLHHHPATEVYYIKGAPESRTGFVAEFGGTVPTITPSPPETIRRDYHEEALLRLSELVPPSFPGVWEPQVVAGDPADAIVRMAEELAVDLIVMGTHGRTGLQHVLLGSVAEKVVRLALCPVLTVRYKAGTA
jgi:nucleotide-binding universal stress UspA family protein